MDDCCCDAFSDAVDCDDDDIFTTLIADSISTKLLVLVLVLLLVLLVSIA